MQQFHSCLIQNKFNIIKKFYQNITSKYINIIKPNLISESEFKIIIDIFNKVFILNKTTSDFIGIAAKSHILHKFAFGNKFRELLDIVFKYDIDISNDILSCEIIRCFESTQSYINLSDIVEITNEYTKLSKSTDQTLTALERMSRRYEDSFITNSNYKELSYYLENDIKDIKQLITFNKLLKRMEDNNLFQELNISLVELFYCCYIGIRLYNPKLSIGYLSDKILPINQFNFIANILNKSYQEIISITVNNKHTDINYNIYKYISILPNYHPYGMTILTNNKGSFADCVENTLLQLIKTHCWDSNLHKFNSKYLPRKSNNKLIKFINLLTIENDNTQEIKSMFGEIVSNISGLSYIYKNYNSYEIESNINNFIFILNYLFGLNSNSDTLSRDLFNSEKNPQITEITLNENIIEYKFSYNSVNFFINKGHSSHSISQTVDVMYDNYMYIKLIKFFTSNYSFMVLINFNMYRFISMLNRDKKPIVNFIELCLDQNLYFLHNSITDTGGTYDVADLIYRNKKFIDHLKLLTIEDYDQVIFKSEFISRTINSFTTDDIKLLQISKDTTKLTRYNEFFPIILECLKRNHDLLTGPYYFPKLTPNDQKTKRNLIFSIITDIYSDNCGTIGTIGTTEIDKIKLFILNPLFDIIKNNNLLTSSIFLSQSFRDNTLYDYIHSPIITNLFGDYFNDKYDVTLFRCIDRKPIC